MLQNPQLDLAFNFIQFTNRSIFLTGRAGTGKTTFLHTLKTRTPKRMVVVAPTGVAAINAGGVTIHSFFQLPFGPYIPGHARNAEDQPAFQKLKKRKINLIKSLDLLVIDEISMVRADLLDAIDDVLRRYRNRNKPFGGLQLLMIGDLHQLAPVAKEEEWNLLKEHYNSVYFFSSQALQKIEPYCIELTHIYRQSDKKFIDLLNKVRNKNLLPDDIAELNKQYKPNFNPDDKEGYIRLTTHNARAFETNNEKLQALKSKSFFYDADISGDFPEYLYPNEKHLELKEGAQVMFIKNDPSPEKLFYNGKIGQVTRISDDEIDVLCPGDDEPIKVTPLAWENMKYELNEESKEIKETMAGMFTQLPLKTAWAITIHKSQGLTFDKAIIDAQLSFAHGQVYVALSRCRTLEGMVLTSPISLGSIHKDSTITAYVQSAEANAPGENELHQSKADFQIQILKEMFQFGLAEYRVKRFKEVAAEHEISLTEEEHALCNTTRFRQEVTEIAERFIQQMTQIAQSSSKLPEENDELQDRIKKGCVYFIDKLHPINEKTRSFLFETDNKATRQEIEKVLEALQLELFTALAMLKKSEHGFKAIDCIQARADASIDFKASLPKAADSKPVFHGRLDHPKLYGELKAWRESILIENDIDSSYKILPYKVIIDLVNNVPVTYDELAAIKGIGKTKMKAFGSELLEIIRQYCIEYNVKAVPKELPVFVEKKRKSRRK